MASYITSWKMSQSAAGAGPPPSKPTLYYVLESPPCQTVIAVARLLGVELDLKVVDVMSEEHKKKEFVKINPFKRVPAFEDTDGFRISESRAICSYLVQSRCPDSPLYPSGDLKKRAIIDMYLHHELGTVYRALSDVIDPFWTKGEVDRSKMPRLEEVLQNLDAVISMNNSSFIAGDQLTLADISLHFHWRVLEAFPSDVDLSVYLAILAWNRKVVEALKPTNADGFFDKAQANLIEFIGQMRQGIFEF